MADLVEIWLLTVMDSPGKSRNEHLLAGSMSLQQLFPNSHQVWGLTRFTRVLSSIFGKSAIVLGVRLGNRPFFLVRRLSGGLGRSGGAVEWWSGGAVGWCRSVIQLVIPLLSWSACSSVLCTWCVAVVGPSVVASVG